VPGKPGEILEKPGSGFSVFLQAFLAHLIEIQNQILRKHKGLLKLIAK
jgi:hypothetical protein